RHHKKWAAPAGAAHLRQLVGADGVVGSFLGDIDIVGVRLPQAGSRDLHELGVLLQLLDGVAAGVAHTGPQAAHELVDGVAGGSLVGDAALHALGNQLLVVLLEVAVLGAVVHGGQRAHAAVGLKLAALIDLGLAGGLLTAGQQRADHDHIAAGGDG